MVRHTGWPASGGQSLSSLGSLPIPEFSAEVSHSAWESHFKAFPTEAWGQEGMGQEVGWCGLWYLKDDLCLLSHSGERYEEPFYFLCLGLRELLDYLITS